VNWIRNARHPVVGFLARRTAVGVLTLLACSILIFLATNVLPGNVVEVILGRNATPALTHALEVKLHISEPLVQRYWTWLEGAARGNLGYSGGVLAANGGVASKSAEISGIIAAPLRNSAILGGITVLCLIPLSLLVGIVTGLNAGRKIDHAVSLTAVALGALPEFVFATFLILAFFTWLALLPPVALVSPGQSPLADPKILVLPVLSLLGITLASCLRQIRIGVIVASQEEYVAAARLNGLPGSRVVWRYIVRNAMASSVQVIAQNVQYLIGGIVIVESVFSYPGIGLYLAQAVSNRDVTEVQAIALILAALYIVINICADLLVVLLVPKLRTGA
jgi:peptide/nickel transport system permease protein